MQITKVKMKDGKITIHQKFDEDASDKTIVLNTKETPTFEFLKAFHNLLPDVESLLEFKSGYLTGFPENMLDGYADAFKKAGLYLGRLGVVTGISFSYSTEGLMGAVVTVLRSMGEVADAPLVINTPLLYDYDMDSEQTKPCLPSVMKNSLDTVISETIKFLEGARGLVDEATDPAQKKLKLAA